MSSVSFYGLSVSKATVEKIEMATDVVQAASLFSGAFVGFIWTVHQSFKTYAPTYTSQLKLFLENVSDPEIKNTPITSLTRKMFEKVFFDKNDSYLGRFIKLFKVDYYCHRVEAVKIANSPTFYASQRKILAIAGCIFALFFVAATVNDKCRQILGKVS